jgi:hypothetical protein
MKKIVFIGLTWAALAVVFACLILIPGQIRARHAAAASDAWYSLKIASVDLEQNGSFTNPSPRYCRIFGFTNRYSISGIVYQCALAADSWDYRDRSNSLAFTTNGAILFIDKHGVIRLRNWYSLVY